MSQLLMILHTTVSSNIQMIPRLHVLW